jgi:death-on-curing protein
VRYLTTGDVARINEILVGPDALVDFGLLEAAVLRPQQTVLGQDAYPDIHTKAAAVLHSLARNHAFIDGNKRTAFLSAVVFYNLNGFDLIANDGDVVSLMLDAAEGQVDVPAIAKSLERWVRPMDLSDE